MISIKQFTFNYFGVNTYIIFDDTREAALIDCGCINRNEEKILNAFIDDNKLTVKRLLCTHYHFDHVVGNRFISDTYGVVPEIHQGELSARFPNLATQAAAFGITEDFQDVDYKHFIEDEEEIHFGNITLKALLVPGHSPASLAFYCAIENIVFTGDTLFYGSIGRTDLWGGNYNTLIESIRQKLLTLPHPTVIYPGHGQSSTIAVEKLIFNS
ncbi:MAG: MBL fold metallo-hydrolase [Tannerella sp.]|jgi:glyoxylase-like metal-dependent hydrolase (beta-lactamase superfamily II)|nr:MBL fold metallo-hydrolase [Tannerella sp.]